MGSTSKNIATLTCPSHSHYITFIAKQFSLSRCPFCTKYILVLTANNLRFQMVEVSHGLNLYRLKQHRVQQIN